MNVTFKYDRGQDIWCILNYGKTSMNSPTPTKVYEELLKEYGDNPSEEDVGNFIDSYTSTNHVDLHEITHASQNRWNDISSEYQKRAGEIFGISLPSDVTVYLTINDRCPYSIENNFFFATTMYPHVTNRTAMHELWHFYTWYKYGVEWQVKLGAQKYNEIKEALTVLLNVECKDLLPEGTTDKGYPQHQELRLRILELWSKDRNMDHLWQALVV